MIQGPPASTSASYSPTRWNIKGHWRPGSQLRGSETYRPLRGSYASKRACATRWSPGNHVSDRLPSVSIDRGGLEG